MKHPATKLLTPLICLGVAFLIFSVDLFLPPGISVAALYVIPIVLLHGSQSTGHTIAMALLCGILTLLGVLFSPDIGIPSRVVMADLAIVLMIIFATATLGVIANRRAVQLHTVSKLLTMCAWTKRVKVRGEWISVEDYLKNDLGVTITHGMSEDLAEKFLTDVRVEDRAGP